MMGSPRRAHDADGLRHAGWQVARRGDYQGAMHGRFRSGTELSAGLSSLLHARAGRHTRTHACTGVPPLALTEAHTLLTSESVDLVAARAGLVDITDEAREAADAVAAHLGLAAIAVIVQGKEGGSASLEVCPWRL